METTFYYKIQAEVTGKTSLGRNLSFLVEKTFSATVSEKAYDYASGKVVSADLEGDFTPEPISIIMQGKIEETCMRYNVIAHTAVIQSYSVSTDHKDVEVYFSNISPSARTTDPNELVYAYYIQDTGKPAVPTNVKAVGGDDFIALSWTINGHAHGIYIYNEHSELIAVVGTDVSEWVDFRPKKDKLNTYYLSSYNAVRESDQVKVSARTLGSLDTPLFTVDSPIVEEERPIAYEEGKMPAFQSGIGDRDDLFVAGITNDVPRETFNYTMQLKGYENKIIQVFPERSFGYRILAYNQYGVLLAETPWRIGVVDGKAPLNQDGAGKDDLRLPIDLLIPEGETSVEYTVELNGLEGLLEVSTDTTGEIHYVLFSTTDESLEEIDYQFPFYGPVVNGKGTYVVEYGQKLLLDEELPSPMYDPILSAKNISEWMILLNSDNPNVVMTVEEEPADYKTERRFLRFKTSASIINHTQTPWNPLIHTGYYYVNQAEHYLYSESKIRGQIAGEVEYVPLKFTFGFHAELSNGETVSTSIAAEVPSDQKLYRISDTDMAAIANDLILKRGLDPEAIIAVDYNLTINEEYPVVLSSRDFTDYTLQFTGAEMGRGYVYAQTTGTVSEHIYHDVKVSVNENDEVFVRPIPRQGAPIIIKDASGQLLRQVMWNEPSDEATFFVDYNYNHEDDYARIILHHAVLDETREIQIFYETNQEDPYYVASEIDLNPMKNIQHTGFLYITDTVEPSHSMELFVNPRTLFANGYDYTVIRVVVKDRLGNPVIGDRILFSSDVGAIENIQSVTDENGMATARYLAPSTPCTDTIEVLNQTTGITVSDQVEIRKESVQSRMTMTTSVPAISLNQGVLVTAYVYGENQEPIMETLVEFETSYGKLSVTKAFTDQFGAAKVLVSTETVPPTGMIVVKAKATDHDLEEVAMVRMLGFAGYHPDYYITHNNLMDVLDRTEARKNLGIYIQSDAPEELKDRALWIENDSSPLVQSYKQTE